MSEPADKVQPHLDENFDDFDDVLDEFNAPAPPPTAALPSTRLRANTRVDMKPPSLPGAPKLGPSEEVNEEELSSEFVRELAKGMESLLKEISEHSGAEPSGSGTTDEAERERALKAAWEAMLIEGMNGETNPNDIGTEYKPEQSGSSKNFQATIQETMRKIKENDPSSSNDPEMQSVEELLKDLGLGEEGKEDEIAGVLEKMMGQLMSKDILYEPLKELHDKFPGYMANPPKPIAEQDVERYRSQMACVEKIVKVFENPAYSDNNAVEVKKVVDLMSEMQSYGSPPEEIMGPLPPGMGFGQDGMPKVPDECTII